jgi:hypothetical protein
MQFENAPNTVMEDFVRFGDEEISILTSYDSGYFTEDGEGFGVGSLKPRSIAAHMALYKPYNTAFDTIVQLMAGFDVATKYVHEYTEDDELWDDEVPGVEEPFDNAKVINNVDQDGAPANAYVPALTDVFYIVSAEDARIFRPGDTVRYANNADPSEYAYAVIERIGHVTDLIAGGYDHNATTRALQLRSVDFVDRTAQVLLGAADNETVIERMFSVRGSDLSYPVQPRGTVPKMFKTYLQVAALDTGFTQRAARDESYINDIARKQMKLMNELKRGRDLLYMYSKGGHFEIPDEVDMGTEGDQAYLADGIWDQISTHNSVQFDATSATTIRASLRTLIEQNFGGESGGPEIRQVFGSALYMSNVEFAYEDQRRYYSTEYIAGVRVMRYESALGLVDFIWNPQFEYKHPLVGGSIRSGQGLSTAIMLSVPDNLTRLEYIGEGPRMMSFIEKGGQREEFLRVELSAGLILNLKQYTASNTE